MPVHDWTRVDDGIFHDFHTVWLVLLRLKLAGFLPPEYYILAEQKALGLGPDILAMGRGPTRPGGDRPPAPAGSNGNSGGGVSVAQAPPRARYVFTRPSGYKQRSLVVRRVENDRIVAVIEIVSPGNKASKHAFHSFVAKAEEFLEAGVHLLLIDLFPPTPRDPDGIHEAIWGSRTEPEVRPTSPHLLTVASYAAGVEERALVEPLAVGDRLPNIPLFLEPDLYIRVPLEETYMSAFQAVPQPWSNILAAPADPGEGPRMEPDRVEIGRVGGAGRGRSRGPAQPITGPAWGRTSGRSDRRPPRCRPDRPEVRPRGADPNGER